MNKRELQKIATSHICAVIRSMDLSQLFGDELCDLHYKEGHDWVHAYLEEIQNKAVARLTPKVLR